MNYWIGQGFGLLATLASILVPVFKKKWQMLTMNIAANVFPALNLIFLNRIGSGIFLFLVAIVQAVVNLIHTLKDTKARIAEKILFFILYVGLGFYGLMTAPNYVPGINAQNLLELLPIFGAVMSMSFVFARREQVALRFYMTCNLTWLVYYIIIGSTAMLGSIFSVITAAFALIRNRKEAKASQ